MLAAFTARPIIELKSRDKSKIESLLAYGDRLLVGLNTGDLRIYRVNEIDNEPQANGRPSSQSKAKQVELLREEEKFSKYKIEQLAIVKEANILISLANGYVSIHDLHTYEFQEVLTKTKGASAFAASSNIVKDSSTGIPSIVSRLAVAVKRKLLLWSWHDMELASETREHTLVTGIKSLTWITGTRIIAGLNSSYVLIDVETSEVIDIVGPGSIGGAPGQDGGRFGGMGVASMGYMGMSGMIPKPLATKLGEGQVLLAKDINTLFIDTNGQSLGRRQIPWSIGPEAVGYSYPYLLALQATKGTLEIRNPETQNLLQSIPLPNASQLHVPQPNVSLAHAGKGFLVSSERCIWRMGALGYDSQIDAMVGRGKLDEAISLLGMLEDALLKDKEGRLRDIKIAKARSLFDERRYRDSLDLFTEAYAPPELVIKLYPSIIAGEPNLAEDSTAKGISDSTTDPRIGSNNVTGGEMALDNAQASAKIDKIEDVPKPSGKPSEKAKPTNISASSYTLAGKDLKDATIELQAFLVGARTRLRAFLGSDGTLMNIPASNENASGHNTKPDLSSLLLHPTQEINDDSGQRLRDTAKLVDTTLFRAYMFASPSLAGPLFRLANFCDSEVVRDKLLETSRYNDLIDFFYGKKLHRQALELLTEFGQAHEPNVVAPQLHGPNRTVSYLQNLPPDLIDLILEFTEWPLQQDQKLAMDIFLADSENAETLPRKSVLEFLQARNAELAVQYLEHIIEELNDDTQDFHHRLINAYLEKLISRDRLTEDERAESKTKLLNFLRSSKHYQSYKVLGQLSRDDPNLYEARAIVLTNMGQHKQALDIYVFKLQDPEKAEEYCNQIYLASESRPSTTDAEDAKPSIYNNLLSLYLSPPPPYEPQWGPALNILAKHGSRLPASSTLDLIPSVLPVEKLEAYFRGRIRSANSVVNESRVVAGLRKSVVVREEAALRLGGRSRKVVISEERVCGHCHKRFGNSAIKVLPSNAVVHYGCSSA